MNIIKNYQEIINSKIEKNVKDILQQEEKFGIKDYKTYQKFARKVYITDDNPRNENPDKIRNTIKKYCNEGIVISDRRKAIKTAISNFRF